MWTVLWAEDDESNYKQRWEKLTNAKVVVELLKKEELIEDEDVIIMPPETDEMWMIPKVFLEEHDEY